MSKVAMIVSGSVSSVGARDSASASRGGMALVIILKSSFPLLSSRVSWYNCLSSELVPFTGTVKEPLMTLTCLVPNTLPVSGEYTIWQWYESYQPK